MPPPVLQLVAGQLIAGRYRIEAPLGEGGMGVVYRAQHLGTGKRCALKFVRSELGGGAQLQKFVDEARVGARIGSHPGLVEVFDAGIEESLQVPFLAMELLAGEELHSLVQREGAVPREHSREILSQLGDALEHAHRAGIVHRDIKPTNVFLTRDHRGRVQVKVLDFGIAKSLERAMTTATAIGTPAYAAPEQLGSSMRDVAAARGFTIARGISPATDVWAIGLVAFELLTGVTAQDYWGVSDLAGILLKTVLEPHPLPSEKAGDRRALLPAGFDDWFARATAHDAARRFTTAGEAIGTLLALLDEPAALGGVVASVPVAATVTAGNADPIARVPEPELAAPRLAPTAPMEGPAGLLMPYVLRGSPDVSAPRHAPGWLTRRRPWILAIILGIMLILACVVYVKDRQETQLAEAARLTEEKQRAAEEKAELEQVIEAQARLIAEQRQKEADAKVADLKAQLGEAYFKNDRGKIERLKAQLSEAKRAAVNAKTVSE